MWECVLQKHRTGKWEEYDGTYLLPENHMILSLIKMMELAHVEDVRVGFFFYLAVNVPITDKTQNIFFFDC